MSKIIAAKYGGPCLKCGDQIKAGSFVNWKRGDGIWHLDEADNKRLKLSVSDASQVGDSYCSNTNQREGKVMSASDSEIQTDTIDINDLLKVLREIKKTVGTNTWSELFNERTLSPRKQTPAKLVEPPKEKEKQSSIRNLQIGGHASRWKDKLTPKQISFCEFMALGSDRADAYLNSYNIRNAGYASNAARKLLEKKKIRDKVKEFRDELRGGDPQDDKENFISAVRSEGVRGGWAFKLTENQERFCQAIANGAIPLSAFKQSGYYTGYHSDKRIRRITNELMEKPKIRIRITELTSGNLPVPLHDKTSEVDRSVVPLLVPVTRPVETIRSTDAIADDNKEFIDNFVELIKAHGRIFHHAIMAHGQKQVGISGDNVEEVEEAVSRSIEILRSTLSEKLS
tara:strand:- start:217 stop:1413 length:1197 start_codon:yes stop_codon:yes gene_type:complete